VKSLSEKIESHEKTIDVLTKMVEELSKTPESEWRDLTSMPSDNSACVVVRFEDGHEEPRMMTTVVANPQPGRNSVTGEKVNYYPSQITGNMIRDTRFTHWRPLGRVKA
jgi:hypothetical protein